MLIKCPECGHDVSDTAVNCPNCGYNIQENINEIRAKIDEQAKLDAEQKAKDEEQRKSFFAWLKKRWILVTLGALVLVFGGIVIYNAVKISKYGFEDCKTAWLIKTTADERIKNESYLSQDEDILHFSVKALLLDDDTDEDVDIYCIPNEIGYSVYASKYNTKNDEIIYMYVLLYPYDTDPDVPMLFSGDMTDEESHLVYTVWDTLCDYHSNKKSVNAEEIKYSAYNSILNKLISKTTDAVNTKDIKDLYE